MKKKNKTILAGTLVAMLSMSQTNALDTDDNRIVIKLTESERNLVLSEMREFLIGVQQITQGVVNKDLKLIKNSAQKLGKKASKAVPADLAAKLPMGFKKLAFDTHSKFDEISRNVEDLEDENFSLSQLSTLLNNCTGCHATYRLVAEKK